MIKTTWFPDGNGIRPELMIRGIGEQRQPPGDFLDRETRCLAVTRQGHDAKQSVFSQRTGSSGAWFQRPPGMGTVMECVIRVHQGDENVDIKQSAHGSQIPSSSISRWMCSELTTSPREGRRGMPFLMG